MSRIHSSSTVARLLLCLSLGAVSSVAAHSQAISNDSAAANFSSHIRWDRIVGVITAQGVSNPVAGIASGTTPWTTTNGAAGVDFTTGEAAFFVNGLVLVGGNASGTPGPVTSVKGALVCNPGTSNQEVSETVPVPLDAQGNADFLGRLEKAPSSACSNPLFLILNAGNNAWIGTAAVRTVTGR